LKEKNERIERDIQRINERQAIKTRLEMVDVKLVIAEYNQLTEKYKDERARMTNLKEEIEQSTQHLDPLKEELEKARAEYEEAKKGEHEQKSKFKKHSDQLAEEMNTFQEKEELIESKNAEIKAMKNREIDFKKRLNSLRLDLESLRSKSHKSRHNLIQKGYIDSSGSVLSPNPDIAQLDAVGEKARMAKVDAYSKIEQIIAQKKEASENLAALERSTQNINDELIGLDNIRIQKQNELRKRDHDCYKAILLLRENTHRFKGRIYEPLILELNVKAKKYADLIEGSVPARILLVGNELT
jgi:structural maintenance of chromosomes protein 5